MTEKTKASTFEADGGGKTVAPMPFMQNGCFLCGKEIGESEPRQFYTTPGSTQLMLGHTGCINKFKANGEQWPVEEKPAEQPKIQPLGDFRRAVFGLGRVAYSDRQLTLLCEQAIAEKGLKAVIPDLIEVLRAVEETL